MMSTRQVREAVSGTIIHKSRMVGLSEKDKAWDFEGRFHRFVD